MNQSLRKNCMPGRCLQTSVRMSLPLRSISCLRRESGRLRPTNSRASLQLRPLRMKRSSVFSLPMPTERPTIRISYSLFEKADSCLAGRWEGGRLALGGRARTRGTDCSGSRFASSSSCPQAPTNTKRILVCSCAAAVATQVTLQILPPSKGPTETLVSGVQMTLLRSVGSPACGATVRVSLKLQVRLGTRGYAMSSLMAPSCACASTSMVQLYWKNHGSRLSWRLILDLSGRWMWARSCLLPAELRLRWEKESSLMSLQGRGLRRASRRCWCGEWAGSRTSLSYFSRKCVGSMVRFSVLMRSSCSWRLRCMAANWLLRQLSSSSSSSGSGLRWESWLMASAGSQSCLGSWWACLWSRWVPLWSRPFLTSMNRFVLAFSSWLRKSMRLSLIAAGSQFRESSSLCPLRAVSFWWAVFLPSPPCFCRKICLNFSLTSARKWCAPKLVSCSLSFSFSCVWWLSSGQTLLWLFRSPTMSSTGRSCERVSGSAGCGEEAARVWRGARKTWFYNC